MHQVRTLLATCFIILITGTIARGQWTHLRGPCGGRIEALAVSEGKIFAGTDSGVFSSCDGCASWDGSALVGNAIHCFSVVGSEIVAGTENSAYRSTDGGASWSPANNGMRDMGVYALARLDTDLFAGADNGIYRSTDAGGSWELMSGQATLNDIQSFLVVSGTVYAGTYGAGVYMSTDRGGSWSASDSGLGMAIVSTLAAAGNDLFAGTLFNGVYRSTDGGASWQAVNAGLGNLMVYALEVADSNMYAATFDGVYNSTDYGNSWKGLPTDSANVDIRALAISGLELIAGAVDAGVWKLPLPGGVNGVRQGGQRPVKFSLRQNYPNPFNPTTTIVYEVASAGYTTLRVYDILGAEVATLVNRMDAPGTKTIIFDASALPSGAYYYRLQSMMSGKSVLETKKMILLK